jgi:hypothetical protein
MGTSTKASGSLSALVKAAALGSLLLFLARPAAVWGAQESPPANFKVAFIGDQGLGPDAVAVLNLI